MREKSVLIVDDESNIRLIPSECLQSIGYRADEARRHYRAAIFIDLTYEPAMKNLERVTSWHKRGLIVLGEFNTQQNRD